MKHQSSNDINEKSLATLHCKTPFKFNRDLKQLKRLWNSTKLRMEQIYQNTVFYSASNLT